MIERYSIPEMVDIWKPASRFARWLEIEILAVEARCAQGLVPEEDLEKIRANAGFSVERINEIEAVVRHDVIAFLTSVSESLGDESRFIHYGMTSSDILDTCLATQLRDSGKLILDSLREFSNSLAGLAIRGKGLICIGRSHGMHAEPTTMGLKFAGYYSESIRCINKLETALETACVGKISGAVGTYAHLDPFVEEYVCAKLGIGREDVATQIVARDRHADFLYALASIGGLLERFGTEVRHLQRTEVGEVEESFTKGQKGSSAMPHKRNPIVSERICGLARLLRGYLLPGLENTALWHERDISHSSAERFVFPDACGVTLYALRKAAGLASGLNLFPDNIEANLEKAGDRFYSQSIMLALVNKGLTREDAYAVIQTAAMSAMKRKKSFLAGVKTDRDILIYMDPDEIGKVCSIEHQLRNEELILKRLGLAEGRRK